MYKVRTRPDKHLVEIIFEGSYDFGQAEFESDVKDAVMQVRSEAGHFDLLSDWSQTSVMDQDRAGQGQGLGAWFIASGLRKSANVLTSVTQRMQLKRVTAGDEHFEFFETVEEARAWLEA